MSRPGQGDIQMDLFYDYRTNVESYPAWQEWLRRHQPPLLVLWCRYDPSFRVEEAKRTGATYPTPKSTSPPPAISPSTSKPTRPRT